jgi:hypothetical protein
MLILLFLGHQPAAGAFAGKSIAESLFECVQKFHQILSTVRFDLLSDDRKISLKDLWRTAESAVQQIAKIKLGN